MVQYIVKRNGEKVSFDAKKIRNAIFKANIRIAAERMSDADLDSLTAQVIAEFDGGRDVPTVEQIQDVVEEKLIAADYAKTAKAYILYRAEHQRLREMDDELVKIYQDLTFKPAEDADLKRENANINADTAMGTMLKYGSEGAKSFYDKYVIPPEIAKAHADGDIHIHDKDFYTLTETCCQIDLIKLFDGGFSTGHGYLREPKDIRSYAALACIAIQANQNEMHGGQSVPNFDYAMARRPEDVPQAYAAGSISRCPRHAPKTRRADGGRAGRSATPDGHGDAYAGAGASCRGTSARAALRDHREEARRAEYAAHGLAETQRHEAGDGGARPQPEHDEFARRRAGAVQLLNYGTDTSPEGAWPSATCSCDRGGPRRRRNADFPGADLQGQGGCEFQSRGSEL